MVLSPEDGLTSSAAASFHRRIAWPKSAAEPTEIADQFPDDQQLASLSLPALQIALRANCALEVADLQS